MAAAAAVGWRGLGHRLVDFFAALGPGFCTLLAFLIQLVLGTEELDEGLLGSIALLEAGADDAQIAAGSIGGTGIRKSEPGGVGPGRLRVPPSAIASVQ